MTTFLVWCKTVTHPHPLLGGEQEGWVSDLGWRQFRTLLDGIAEKYGRDFRVISRWKATSQICSDCGFKSGKLDLSVREWECLECGAKHDRDENAAINILVAPWVCLLPPAEELPFSCREAKRRH